MSIGQGIAAVAVVLGAFSRRKQQKLGRLGNGDVVLSVELQIWVQRLALAQREEEQRRGMSGRRRKKGGACSAVRSS
jgi:ATP/maltotriose-dependent transcriptional regulator MalT